VSILLQEHPGAPNTDQFELYGRWKFMGLPWAFVLSLVAHPAETQTIYAALGQEQGIYRSDDGGVSWTPRNLGLTSRNVNVVAHSWQQEALLIGTDDGLWISRDRGDTWVRKHSRYQGKKVICALLSPHDPKFLLIGTLRPGGSSVGAGTVLGLRVGASVDSGHLHLSRDDGATWATFAFESVNDACIAYDDDRLAYLASADGGLFRTRDSFETIERLAAFPAPHPLSVSLSPIDSRVAMVGTLRSGLFQTFDAGESWEKVESIGAVQVSRISFLNTKGDHILAATRSGVFESTNSGREWRAAGDGLDYAWCLAVTWLQGGTAVAGTSGGGIYLRRTNQKNWTPSNEGFPPAAGLVLASGGGQLLFAGTPIGLFRTRDSGSTWTLSASSSEAVTAIALAVPDSPPQRTPFDRVAGLYVSYDEGQTVQHGPTAGQRHLMIYIGTGHGRVLRSFDGGANWEQAASLSSEADEWRRSAIHALTVGAGGVVYAALEHVGVRGSDDAGRTWTPIAADTGGTLVTCLHLSRREPRRLYVGIHERGLHFSDDGGKSWSAVSELLGEVVTEVVEPLRATNVILCVTLDCAVYRSLDGGETWALLRKGTGRSAGDHKGWATLAVSPDGNRIALGGSGGCYLSSDAGQSWALIYGGVLGVDYYVNDLIFVGDEGGTLVAAMVAGIFATELNDRKETTGG
jgi:photosystem II stability/assembly factor-like uncharacterized protein